ncbi:MAG: hypothetical protein CR996_00885 [Draconibacterium sp.]|nr:MAG: hypothetical protein CR996_00885 [Draconibacterium sp.]
MNIDTIIVIAVIIYILIAFFFELLRPGLILFSAAVVFLATGIITAHEMVDGFSNTGVITIAVLFLVNEGVKQSGLISKLAIAYLPRKKNNLGFLLPRIMIPISFLSAFLNNLPIVVNVTPILSKWADLMKIPLKKLLIPLSYAAIFGGMFTLVGTSSNLVVHGLMIENGYQGMHLFELAKLGLIIAAIGFIYMAVFSNLLLPGKRIITKNENTEAKDYYYNIWLTEGSNLVGQTIINNKIPGLNGLKVTSIERNNKLIKPGNGNIKIRKDDEILLSGPADRLNYILSIKNVKLKGIDLLEDFDQATLKKYEVVLAPRFTGLGLTLSEFNFFEHFQAAVLAVHRNGERITANLNNLKLKVGDNLVLLGTENFGRTWGSTHMFYLVNYIQDLAAEKTNLKKWVALIILILMIAGILINEIVSYGFGIRLSIFFMVAVAALLLFWTKILPTQNYTKHISWDLIITIASAFAVSKAIQNTGAANALAGESIQIVKSLGPFGVLAIIYLITALLTEIITNNAAVALVFPIAIVAAKMLGVDPKPFFVAIAIAGASSFMTARGYRSNLIIKAVGHYSRKDFFKIGAPLQIITFIISIFLIPLIWAF